MGQDEGPSERLLLWTVYMLPVVAGAVALILLRAGQVVGETGGVCCLHKVVFLTKTPKKR